MGSAWQVFTRDVRRIARVPKAWIIIIGVIITPSLYAWFNIAAFWDPYTNTSGIHVAVANLDAGADSDLAGEVDVGSRVTEQLQGNNDLGWSFETEDGAREAVRTGDAYAAIILPENFSKDLVGLLDGDLKRPQVEYLVNEKANAIATKVTDVGASTVESQINSQFLSAVTEAIAEELKDAGIDVENDLLTAKNSSLSAVDDSADEVSTARDRVANMRSSLSGVHDRLGSAQSALESADSTLGEVQTAVDQAEALAADAQKELVTFSDEVTRAYVDGTSHLADASSQANSSISQLTGALDQTSDAVDSAITDVTAVTKANDRTLNQLQDLLEQARDEQDSQLIERLENAIEALQDRNADDQDVLKQLQSLNGDVSETAKSVQKSADALSSATDQAETSAKDIRTALTKTIPDVNRAMAELSASAGAFSDAISTQRGQLDEAGDILQQLENQLDDTADALASLDKNLAGVEDGLGNIRTDIVALSTADGWDKLQTLTGLSPDKISDFMAEPVQVDEHVVFPVATYGSAMAALFTNLSLWIGAFVLMVIFKLEVDTEGLEAVSLTSAYLGRWLLFAVLAVLQAILVCVGDLVIGVQTVNAFAFIGTGVLISIAYLSIIYGLSVTFGYVGKGLCIVLVIMQIPGASGLYPIEMMPGFFRALYPLFPFTYGIDALRETIGGFYGAHYWGFLGALAVFVAVAFLLGIALRRSLVNLTLMFNTRVAETGLLSSERVQGYRGRFRLSRILFALSSNREFRQQVASRKRLMNVRYPVILRTTVIVVLVGGLLVAVLGGFGVIGKATQLGLWVALLLIMFAVFVGLEYGRDRLDAAFELSTMSRTELQETLFAGGSDHNSAELSSPVAVSPASAEHEAEEASDSTEIDTAVTVKSGDDEAVLDDDTDALEILKSLFAQDSAQEQSADTLHEPDEPTSDSGGDDEGSSS